MSESQMAPTTASRGIGRTDASAFNAALREMNELIDRLAPEALHSLSHTVDSLADHPERFLICEMTDEATFRTTGIALLLKPSAAFGELVATLRALQRD